MSFNKLYDVLKRKSNNYDRVVSIIEGFGSGNVAVGYIFEEVLNMLEDSSPSLRVISEGNAVALCNMLRSYIDKCWEHLGDSTKIDKLWKCAKTLVYKVEDGGEVRYATKREIDNGVRGLFGDEVYRVGKEVYIRLGVLLWMFTGDNKYLLKSGFKLSYDEASRDYKETLYEKISMTASVINDIFSWVDTDDFDNKLKELKDIQKKGSIKYVAYLNDEITERLGVKQVAIDIINNVNKGTCSKEMYRAYMLSWDYIKKGKKIEPLDIVFIRNKHEELTIGSDGAGMAVDDKEDNNNENDELRKECEDILEARINGKIQANHFVFRIIESLEKNRYSKVSQKQYDIIREAHSKIGGAKKQSEIAVEEQAATTEDNGIMNMSDILGSGELS